MPVSPNSKWRRWLLTLVLALTLGALISTQRLRSLWDGRESDSKEQVEEGLDHVPENRRIENNSGEDQSSLGSAKIPADSLSGGSEVSFDPQKIAELASLKQALELVRNEFSALSDSPDGFLMQGMSIQRVAELGRQSALENSSSSEVERRQAFEWLLALVLLGAQSPSSSNHANSLVACEGLATLGFWDESSWDGISKTLEEEKISPDLALCLKETVVSLDKGKVTALNETLTKKVENPPNETWKALHPDLRKRLLSLD